MPGAVQHSVRDGVESEPTTFGILPNSGRVHPASRAVVYRMVFYTVYSSAASHALSDGELNTLLTVSRRNNRRDNITGLLLYVEGNFFQVLEGKQPAVEALYERILRDTRHSRVVHLVKGEHPRRQFPEWAMAFRRASGSDVEARLPGFTNALEQGNWLTLETNHLSSRVLTMLKAFRSVTRA